MKLSNNDMELIVYDDHGDYETLHEEYIGEKSFCTQLRIFFKKKSESGIFCFDILKNSEGELFDPSKISPAEVEEKTVLVYSIKRP